MYGLTPYDCGLGWSVKLEKDFIGKEALVKAKEEGPKYKLVGVELDPERESYEDICQNEVACYKGIQVGVVRQMIYGYTVDKNIGFAIVDIKHAEKGTVLEVGSHGATVTVCDKNFI
ncbi:MAG: glycine cleavage T C-terminal barrel domain-containing protein [Bacillota bacterium]|nr:glycine cleavage T C-terminal barrel domain-containing protein [Bacillota bacterium]